MSNVVNQNPLIVDTAAATVIITEAFRLKKLLWVNSGGDIAPGDQVVAKHKDGTIFFDFIMHDIGTANNVITPVVDINFDGFLVNGLIVSTLTHGKLYVYYDGPVPLKTT